MGGAVRVWARKRESTVTQTVTVLSLQEVCGYYTTQEDNK